ncbi:MAG: translocation/assembly module TamB domain-containing protein, partial [Candidatus Zixiibacteriota bacterium]
MKKRFKIPLSFFLFVILLLCGTYLLLTQTALLEGQVNHWTNYFLGKSYPIQVKIGDIKGSFFNELIIEDFILYYSQPDNPYPLIKSKEVTLRYSLMDWWKGKKILRYVSLVQPEIEMRKIKDKYLLPVPVKIDTIKKVDSEPSYFRMDTLKIEEGSFIFSSEKEERRIEKINLALSFLKDEQGLKLVFSTAGLSYPERNVNVEGIKGKVDWVNNELNLKNLSFKTDSSQLEVSGTVSNLISPRFSLDIKTSPLSLDEMKRIIGVGLSGKFDIKGNFKGDLKSFGGYANLTGALFEREFENIHGKFSYQKKKLTFIQVEGMAFGSPLSGSGEIDFGTKPETYNLEASVENLDLPNIVPIDFHTDFTGSLYVEGKSFSPDDFAMKLKVDLEDGRIDKYTFSKAKGDFDLDLSHIRFHPDFVIVYKNTHALMEGDIHFDQRVDIKAEIDFADVNDFRGQFFLKELSGKGKAHLEFGGTLSDLNIKGEIESDSLWIYKWYTSGLSGYFQILNFSTSQSGFFDLDFAKGNLWGMEYDSAGVKLSLQNQIVKIDTAWAQSQDMDLGFSGLVDNSTYPTKLELAQVVFDFDGNLFQSDGKIEVDSGKDSINVKSADLSLGEGKIKLSGLIQTNKNIDLMANLSRVDISPWIDRAAPQSNMEGTLNASLDLKGNFDQPEIELKGEVEGYKLKEVDLGKLDFDLSYRNRKLDIRKAELSRPDGRYTLTGFFPLSLSLTSFENELLDQPQKLTILGKGEELKLFPLFLPWMEYVKGSFETEIDISGTPLSPQFDGYLKVDSGSLKLTSLENPATNLQAELVLSDQNLKFNKLEGEVSHRPITRGNILKRIWRLFFPKKEEKGRIFGSGEITFKKINQVDYDFQVKGTNVPFRYRFTDISGIADFDLKFRGTDPSSISGDLFFHQLLYQEPFGALSSMGKGEKNENVPIWLDLKLSADHNCWVINQDMNVEFKGELSVSRSGNAFSLLGNLETIRGKYFLYGNTFKIESGSFVFNNLEKIDAKLDLLVSADIATGYSPTERSEFVKTYAEKVELSIQGNLSAPEVKPPPDSPYSREEIL